MNRINDENVDLIIVTDQNINYLNIDNIRATVLLNIILTVGMVHSISRPIRITHTSATLIDSLYVKIKRCLVYYLLTCQILLTIFIFMCTKTKSKPKPFTFKCRKLYDNAFKNITFFFGVSDWSYLDNIVIEEPYEKFVDIIHEYTTPQTVN